MRLYDISCKQCGYKLEIPVDENAAKQIVKHRCRECMAAERPDSRFTATEHIVVGPTLYAPGRTDERQ
jgi:hypothetical protein